MISKQEAINIALKQMPEPEFKVVNIVLKDDVFYIGLEKGKYKFEVDVDAITGKVIGGGGGA